MSDDARCPPPSSGLSFGHLSPRSAPEAPGALECSRCLRLSTPCTMLGGDVPTYNHTGPRPVSDHCSCHACTFWSSHRLRHHDRHHCGRFGPQIFQRHCPSDTSRWIPTWTCAAGCEPAPCRCRFRHPHDARQWVSLIPPVRAGDAARRIFVSPRDSLTGALRASDKVLAPPRHGQSSIATSVSE